MTGQPEQLLEALRRAAANGREAMRARWDRDLPLDELVIDRWERARGLGFGEGSSIYGSSCVFGDVQVGRNTWIGPFTLLDGSGGLEIGENCSISTGVQIYSHDTVNWALSGGAAAYEHAPVTIGSCCYIGPETVVAKGVTIGDHTLVGACSFVNKDVPAHSIVVGVPCRVVGKVVLGEEGRVELTYDQ